MASKKKRKKKAFNGETKGEKLYNYLLTKGKEFAEELKTKATKEELIIHKILSTLKYNFQFQYDIICNKKHLYILDFLLTDYSIGLEIDGWFHNLPINRRKDNLRTKRLLKEGIHIIRLTNSQVKAFSYKEIDQVIKTKIQLISVKNNQ